MPVIVNAKTDVKNGILKMDSMNIAEEAPRKKNRPVATSDRVAWRSKCRLRELDSIADRADSLANFLMACKLAARSGTADLGINVSGSSFSFFSQSHIRRTSGDFLSTFF